MYVADTEENEIFWVYYIGEENVCCLNFEKPIDQYSAAKTKYD